MCQNRPIAAGGRRRGAVLMYVMFAMVAFVGFASLAIDWGHVRCVKTELQAAADAAARYGATALPNNYASAAAFAATAAGYNTADGSQVVLNQATDVQLGTWDATARTFTVLSGANQANANAIRVYARRTSANGNAVRLPFAGLLGMSSYDVTASAIALSSSAPAYGIIGLNGVTLSGNSVTAYWSSSGTGSTNGASVASNAGISLSGGAILYGDAWPGPGHGVSATGGSSVTGTTTPLPAALSYPNASAGSAATTNNDAAAGSAWDSSSNSFSLSSGSLTLPGGTYYFNNFRVMGSTLLTFSGPATVYVTGQVALSGPVATAGSLPANLNVEVIGSGSINVSAGGSLYATIYAPQSAVTVSGSGAYYGSILGYTVTGSGSAQIHNDLSLVGQHGGTLVQ